MIERWVRPYFGNRLLDEIEPLDVGEFTSWLSSRGLSPKYRRNLYSLVRQMFQLAMENDLVESTPVRTRIHRPKVPAREKSNLSVEQALKILDHVTPQWQAAIFTLALTGIRVGELLGLRWQDVDVFGRRIQIVHSLWRGQLITPKTAKSARVLAMCDPLREVLIRHRRESWFTDPDNFLFCREDGSPQSADAVRRKGIYSAFRRAGVPIIPRESGCHVFRHLAGSIIHRQTGSLKLVQTQLGHSNVSTGDIYTHVDEASLEQTAKILGDVLGKTCCRSVVESTDQVR